MYTIFDKFASIENDFNPASAKDVSLLKERLHGGPELMFVEVSADWIKFQDSPYTTRPEMSVTVYPHEGNTFSRANIRTVLQQSKVFGEPSTIVQIEKRLANYRLDAGAVFTIDDGAVSFLGNTFQALSRATA